MSHDWALVGGTCTRCGIARSLATEYGPCGHIGDFTLAELVGPDGLSDTAHLFTVPLTGGAAPAHVDMHAGHAHVRYALNGRHLSGLVIYRRS